MAHYWIVRVACVTLILGRILVGMKGLGDIC